MTDDTFFRPRRLGHANLWVDNLARSEAFYHDSCGLTIEFWEPDLKATFLGTGNTPHDLGMIETTGGEARYGRNGLLQIPEGVGAKVGLGHLAWELGNEGELVAAYEHALAADIALDMTVDHQVAHSVYLYDPDGNYMEYYCDTVRDWRGVLHGEMELITSGWDPTEHAPSTESLVDPSPEIRVVASAPIHPRRLTHAVLVSDAPERLVSFYTSVGGLTELHRTEDVVLLRADASACPFHLAICGRHQTAPGYHHISFELADEPALLKALADTVERGLAPALEVDDERKRSFYLRDPDGFLSEYYVGRSPDLPELTGVDGDRRPYLV